MQRTDDEFMDAVSVVLQNEVNASDLGGKRSIVAKPKVEHASVGLVEAEHKIPKVAIVGYQDSVLRASDCENVDIWQTSRVLVANPDGVMAP